MIWSGRDSLRDNEGITHDRRLRDSRRLSSLHIRLHRRRSFLMKFCTTEGVRISKKRVDASETTKKTTIALHCSLRGSDRLHSLPPLLFPPHPFSAAARAASGRAACLPPASPPPPPTSTGPRTSSCSKSPLPTSSKTIGCGILRRSPAKHDIFSLMWR